MQTFSLVPANPGPPGKMAVKMERESQGEREREKQRDSLCKHSSSAVTAPRTNNDVLECAVKLDVNK